MDRIAPLTPQPEMRMQSAPHAAETGPAAQAAARRLAEYKAALQNDVLPNDIDVRLDAEAGRFVSTLTDVNTSEMLRRYPSESQLAYSRAVMAYLRALGDR